MMAQAQVKCLLCTSNISVVKVYMLVTVHVGETGTCCAFFFSCF
jgi:hypothetical protein